MDKPWGIALGIYAIILWILLFYVWYRGFKEWKANRANRSRKYPARVLDKRESAAAQGAPEQFAVFEFTGRQVEFQVDPETYAAVRVGDEGILHVRGRRFEAFEHKTQDERVDEVYRKMVKD